MKKTPGFNLDQVESVRVRVNGLPVPTLPTPARACDIDGVRPSVWICERCQGHCCEECVTFTPPAKLNRNPSDIGKVLCFRCDGVVGGIGHQKRLAREVPDVA